MNLPDFTQFEPLNRLKEQMGLPRDQYGAFPQTSHKPRAWILLKSGRRLDLLDPRSDAWTDKDLAIWISRTYRWGGYSKWDLPLSVAQHSLAVLALREAEGPLTAREALREILHDAPELSTLLKYVLTRSFPACLPSQVMYIHPLYYYTISALPGEPRSRARTVGDSARRTEGWVHA